MAVPFGLSNAKTSNTFITEPILEPSSWAENEFGNALLGDPRLDFQTYKNRLRPCRKTILFITLMF